MSLVFHINVIVFADNDFFEYATVAFGVFFYLFIDILLLEFIEGDNVSKLLGELARQMKSLFINKEVIVDWINLNAEPIPDQNWDNQDTGTHIDNEVPLDAALRFLILSMFGTSQLSLDEISNMGAVNDNHSEKWEPFPRSPVIKRYEIHGLNRNNYAGNQPFDLIGETLHEMFLRFLDFIHICRSLLVVV